MALSSIDLAVSIGVLMIVSFVFFGNMFNITYLTYSSVIVLFGIIAVVIINLFYTKPTQPIRESGM